MVVALAVWSLVIEPGKKITHEVFRDIKITNAALGAKLEDEKARSTLKIFYTPPPTSDDEEDEEEEKDTKKTSPKKGEKEISTLKEVTLCSLIPNTIEQATLDLTFVEDDIVQFEVVGKNSIHLFGNYIDQDPMADMPPEDDYDEDDEESVNLLDVSSDVEIDPAELDGLDDSDDDANRFEELPDDEPVTGKKHRREEDDTMDGDVSMTTEQAAKKLKGESGEAKSKKNKKKNKKEQKDEAESATNGQEASTSPEKAADDKKKKGGAAELKDLGEGLKVKDVKVGSGKQAKPGNTILMRYIGKLPSGKVFDSNTKGKPFTFRLGKGEVIKGWDLGVAGMQVGGERLIIVPPAQGYGKQKTGDIPPNSTLHFECKLLEIK